MSVVDDAIAATPGLHALWPLSESAGATTCAITAGVLIGNGTFAMTMNSGHYTLGEASIIPNDTSTCLRKTDDFHAGTVPSSSFMVPGWTASNPDSGYSAALTMSLGVWFQATRFVGTQYLWSWFGNWQLSTTVNGFGGSNPSSVVATSGTFPNPINGGGDIVAPYTTYFAVVTIDLNPSVQQTKIYLNGTLLSTRTSTGRLATATAGNIALGAFTNASAGSSFQGWLQKPFMHSACLTAAQIQNIYMTGVQAPGEVLGQSMNTYGWSRPVAPANTGRTRITLTNDSDAVIYCTLGPVATLGAGIRLAPFGGTYSSDRYRGAVSAINDARLGAKNLCIVEE